jgi:ribosome-associated protein
MRSVDTAPLQAALDEINGVSVQAKAHQKRLEKLRDRVMASDGEFALIARDYPQADIQQLRQLRRNALKEIEHSKPPRAFRELFRQLRALIEGDSPQVSAGETAITDDDESPDDN